MKTPSAACLLTPLLLLLDCSARADEEQDLIAILQSDANASAKSTACLKLRIVGTADSVPVLANLLDQERISHAARYALEGMPYPQAGSALRSALNRTSGLIKAGLLDSLGRRREPESIPLLAPLLTEADATIASAAATALGRIGGSGAVVALVSARDRGPAPAQNAVLEGLLRCADDLRASGDHPRAVALYRDCSDPRYPMPVRIAAWRGLVLWDPSQRLPLLTQALSATDQPMHSAALQSVRETADPQVIEACLPQWDSLPAGSQLALLDAHLKLGSVALPTVRRATQSPHLDVRVAAWQALANFEDPSAIPSLAAAAARAQPVERDAASDALTRMHGPAVREAMLRELNRADAPEKTVLLRALGQRGDTGAVDLLLEHASSVSRPIRLAALDSLTTLALPGTLEPLLELAAKSKSEAERDPVLKALRVLCQASEDNDQTTSRVLNTMERLPIRERRQLLPLLAELGTPAALTAALTASRDSDPESAREAVRVLGQWANAAPASHLIELARTGTDPTLRTLSLRAGIAVAEHEPDASKRLAHVRQALKLARNADEKQSALSQLGRIPLPGALQLALEQLTDPNLAGEAALATISIAEQLAGSDPKLADEAAAQILAHCDVPEVVRRAWALRSRPGTGGPFIRDWLICGPYRKDGVVGATAVFNLALGPENPGEDAQWRALPPTEHVNLAALFPGQDNCVAYLKSSLVAPEDCSGVILLGSDDGVKVWLNGKVVHSNNVDRGEVADQDVAPIQLKKGDNDLMLKITQGGGGWSVSARIVSADGLPIPGLRVAPQAVPTP